MTVHLNLALLKKKNVEKAKLHYMPCIIKTNGDAKVSVYFESIIKERHEDKDKVLVASFRGYPLLGKEITVPQNYCGLVFEEKGDKIGTERERNLYAYHTFDKFTYWNWDSEPNDNDKIVIAFDWLDIADALHSPLDT